MIPDGSKLGIESAATRYNRQKEIAANIDDLFRLINRWRTGAIVVRAFYIHYIRAWLLIGNHHCGSNDV